MKLGYGWDIMKQSHFEVLSEMRYVRKHHYEKCLGSYEEASSSYWSWIGNVKLYEIESPVVPQTEGQSQNCHGLFLLLSCFWLKTFFKSIMLCHSKEQNNPTVKYCYRKVVHVFFRYMEFFVVHLYYPLQNPSVYYQSMMPIAARYFPTNCQTPK